MTNARVAGLWRNLPGECVTNARVAGLWRNLPGECVTNARVVPLRKNLPGRGPLPRPDAGTGGCRAR